MIELWIIISVCRKRVEKIEAVSERDAWATWWKELCHETLAILPTGLYLQGDERRSFDLFVQRRKEEGFRAVVLREVTP